MAQPPPKPWERRIPGTITGPLNYRFVITFLILASMSNRQSVGTLGSISSQVNIKSIFDDVVVFLL